jgi:plastocyanin
LRHPHLDQDPITMPRLCALLLPLALSLAAGCSSNDTGPSTPPDGPGDISIVRGASLLTTTAFAPNPKTISLADGGEVRWVNGDGGSTYGGGAPESHQIASDNGAFATSQPFAPGHSYTVTLTESGTYHYHCAIHPNMVGTVTVTP